MKLSFEKSLKFGVVSGVILIVISVLLYALRIDSTNVGTSAVVTLINLAIIIVFAVVAAIRTREDFGGHITYGSAFLTSFIVILIAYYLNALYSFVFNAYIDPEYSRIVMENAIEKYIDMIPEESIDLMIENMEKSLNPTKNLITQLWSSPIFSVVLSAIIALFIKKEKNLQ